MFNKQKKVCFDSVISDNLSHKIRSVIDEVLLVGVIVTRIDFIELNRTFKWFKKSGNTLNDR